jgi:F0F1-type ATP synthase assembly protein I
MKTTPRPAQSTLQQLGPYMGLGFQLAAAMAVFGAIGWWLDERWKTTPWLLVVGVLLGAVGGMISIIRTSIRSGRPKADAPSANGPKGRDGGEHSTD